MVDVRRAARIIHGLGNGEPVEVGVIVPDRAFPLAVKLANEVRAEVRVVGYEIRYPTEGGAVLDHVSRLANGTPVSAELNIDQVRAGKLDELAARDFRLKFRTGGEELQLFPSPAVLAEVIVAATSLKVPFKLTAGLHEPVRHTDENTGFSHHGFLNIAAATSVALQGGSVVEVSDVLSSTDLAVLKPHISDTEWRSSFTSFGTCSISEPIEGLARLDPASFNREEGDHGTSSSR